MKGENGTSNPTQPRRPACESAGATAPETHPTLLDIARLRCRRYYAPSRGEGQHRRPLCSGQDLATSSSTGSREVCYQAATKAAQSRTRNGLGKAERSRS